MYTSPIRREDSPYPDLLFFYPRFALLHTEAFFTSTATNPFMYPAAAVPVYQLFYAAAPHVVAAYLSFSLGALLLAAVLVGQALVQRGIEVGAAASYVGLSLLCAYPIWFALTQANIEIVLWALLAGGVALYWHGRGYSAAVCFGLAAALKIYPALFLVLPLYRKRWGQTVVGAALAVAYSFLSLWYVGPTLSQASSGIATGLERFRNLYMLRVREETGVDHSLFTLYKVPFRDHVARGRFPEALPLYLGAMALLVLVLLFTRVRKLPLSNQLAFCVVVCVLLPPTSFEYTLLHLLTLTALLLMLLLDAARAGKRVPGLLPALTCCTIGLMFLPELIYNGNQIDGQIKSLVLVVLLFIVLRYPFSSGYTAQTQAASPQKELQA